MKLPLPDRRTAGQWLAEALAEYRGRKPLHVLALPRGGVPVALEVARELGADLDLMLVRKLPTPGHAELAMGAIASGGVRTLNRDLVDHLGIREQDIERAADLEQRELERREKAYRGDRPWPELAGSTVILVDDGLATGATMKAALKATQGFNPEAVVVAVPVAPADTIAELRSLADDVVCLAGEFHGHRALVRAFRSAHRRRSARDVEQHLVGFHSGPRGGDQ